MLIGQHAEIKHIPKCIKLCPEHALGTPTHRRRLALSSTRTPYGCHRSSSTTVVFAAAGRRGAGVMTTPATSASKGSG